MLGPSAVGGGGCGGGGGGSHHHHHHHHPAATAAAQNAAGVAGPGGGTTTGTLLGMPRRSPFAIQELLGLGPHHHEAPTSTTTITNSAATSSSLHLQRGAATATAAMSVAAAAVTSAPYTSHGGSLLSPHQSQHFLADPLNAASRMYFNPSAAFLPNIGVHSSVAGPAIQAVPLLGLDHMQTATTRHESLVGKTVSPSFFALYSSI